MRPESGVLARAFTALLLAALAGCSGLTELRGDKAVPPAAPSREMLQAAQVGGFLASLLELVLGCPAEQAEVLAGARAGYDQAHQGPAALRYALVLGTPGHPGRDPLQAQKLLRECLARPELLTSGERGYAVVELQRVEAEMRLTAENTRLVEEAQRERARQNTSSSTAAITRRLQAEQEETAKLRRQLEEAKAKLDAIADIERSNADRPAANEGRTP
jgi:hypothetical protein